MQALKRALAAWLAVSLAAAPGLTAAGFERAAGPMTGVPLTSAPLAPALPAVALPATALPQPLTGDFRPMAEIPAAPAVPPGLLAPAAAPAGARAALSPLSPRGENGDKSKPPEAAALPQLQAAADSRRSPEHSGLAFDGGRLSAARADDAPASGAESRGSGPLPAASAPGSSAPAPQPPAPSPRRSWLKRLNESTRPSSRREVWLERAILLGAAVTLAAPVVWHARPFHTLVMNTPAALAPYVAASGLLTVYRLVRFLLGKERPAARAPPKRAALWRAAALGLALGAGLGTLPTIFQPQLVAAVSHHAAPADHAVIVRGDALGRAIVADLSANPVGRRVLDGLRDRSGAIRLPVFLVTRQTDAIASHVSIYDSVFLSEAEIKSRGWTVEDFVKDPAKQAAYIHDNQALFAHELTHAVQARRSPLEPGQFSSPIEYEYEAYVTQHFYAHEQLKADPHTNLVSGELGNYEVQLDDIDGFLRELDSDSAYKKDTHLDSPRYRAWRAQLHRDWPAHQLEGYALLVRRYEKAPFLVAQYKKKAAAVAAAHGLPLPPDLRPAEVK